MNLLNYKIIKTEFINNYKTYQTTDNIAEFISRVVIPYFEPLACDLKELVDSIKNQTDNSIQVIDYLEVIFNSKLYDSFIYANTNNDTTKTTDNYIHYLIILIEFTKYQEYQEIEGKLKTIQYSNNNTFLQDLLIDEIIKKSQYSLDKIKQVYKDLIDNFSCYNNSITACNELLGANNIKIN